MGPEGGEAIGGVEATANSSGGPPSVPRSDVRGPTLPAKSPVPEPQKALPVADDIQATAVMDPSQIKTEIKTEVECDWV